MFKNHDELISALLCVEFPQVQNIDFSVKDYILKDYILYHSQLIMETWLNLCPGSDIILDKEIQK